MKIFWPPILILFLFIIFILEGFGLPYGHEICFYLLLTLPFFLFVIDLLRKKKTQIPRKLSLLLLIFFTISFVSTIFSVNIQRSLETLLLYLSFFLIFLYIFNHQNEIKKSLTLLIISISFLLTSYSFISILIFKKSLLVSANSLSLIYNPTAYHNYFGDFLILPIIIGCYFLFQGKLKTLSTILIGFFLPLVIFTYSRSAFASLFMILAIMFFKSKRQNKQLIKFLFPFFLVIILFTVSISIESINIPLVSSINRTLTKNVNLRSKPFLGKREAYISQGLMAIKNYPMFGVGLGNFMRVSFRFNDTSFHWSRTSHNLFLDVFAENGILAGIIFLLIIYLIIRYSKKDLLFFLFLVLLINFQTIASYSFYSIFLLFFILAGLIYQERNTVNGKFIFSLSCLIFLISALIVLSQFFLRLKNYRLAFYVYPLNKGVYIPLIEKEIIHRDYNNGLMIRRLYQRLFSGEPDVLYYLGEIDLRMGSKKEALTMFKKSQLWSPFEGDIIVRLKKIYSLEKELNGQKVADEYVNSFFAKVEKIKGGEVTQFIMRQRLQLYCEEIYKKCPYQLVLF